MYILYAPVEKFGNLPPKAALLSEEVLFTHNVAYCPKFFWKKYHCLQGVRDITPNWLKRKRASRVLNKILIIATGGMGDSMWSMPFAKHLRLKYPTAKIIICTQERNMPLWKGVPYADVCMKDEYWNLQALIRNADEVWDFGGIATFMKSEMRLDPIEAIFKTAEEPLPALKKDCRPMLVITGEEGRAIEKILLSEGVDTKNDKIISIGLNSSTPNRDWPFEYVCNLSSMLLADGFKVVWLSDKKDFSRFDEVSYPTTDGVLNLAGKTNIRQGMAIIALSDLYIGPNSANMVISTALQIPTVGLFGAFTPRTRTKFYERFVAAVGRYKCSPCTEHWTECPEGHPAPCMKQISPEQVYSLGIGLIKKYPRTTLEKRPIE